jgi:phosphoribosylformylglycinamidine cyclo-ligase
MDYKTSGVDVTAGRAFVERIKSCVEKTHTREVIGGLGGFGGCIRIPKGYERPVLVSGTDGVGTKLELAQQYGCHFGVGIDLVAMCVNDVITNGARPLFFLDYIASGTLTPDALAEVIEGIAEGCGQSDCSLLGGETAEMPGFYPSGRYDLAGFCVGIVENDQLINGMQINCADQIIGIKSNGVHSNGFSLVREVLSMANVDENTLYGKNQRNLIKSLLEPTAIYVQLVDNLLRENIPIHGMTHITGGGLPENLPRIFPSGLLPQIDMANWEIPEIFNWLQNAGDIPEIDLWNTFNMGIGFCLIVPKNAVNSALEICIKNDFEAWNIGQVVESSNNTKNIDILGIPS